MEAKITPACGVEAGATKDIQLLLETYFKPKGEGEKYPDSQHSLPFLSLASVWHQPNPMSHRVSSDWPTCDAEKNEGKTRSVSENKQDKAGTSTKLTSSVISFLGSFRPMFKCLYEISLKYVKGTL